MVVDVLSSVFGSGIPAGLATVAVFVSVCVRIKSAAAVAVTMNVAVPLLAKLTAVLIEPLPDARPVEPAEYVAFHVAEERPTGSASVTVAPVTAEGPALETTRL